MLISLLVKNFITKTLLTALMSLYWFFGTLMLAAAGVVCVFEEDALAAKAKFFTSFLTAQESTIAAAVYYSACGALVLAVFCSAIGVILALFGMILNMWIRTIFTIAYTVAAVWIWIWLLGGKL